MDKNDLSHTQDWFTNNIPLVSSIMDTIKPSKILEVGSFEGLSTCFMLSKAAEYADEVNMYCVDTWEGGVEHAGIDFEAVEKAFDSNVQKVVNSIPKKISVFKVKGKSMTGLSRLLLSTERNFDMIYIDGSHMPTDVLLDATMSFPLLRVGGVMVFDDYCRTDQPELEHPQIAIDAFLAVHAAKIKRLRFLVDSGNPDDVYDLEERIHTEGKVPGLYQMYIMKTVE